MNKKLIERIAKKFMEECGITFFPTELELQKDLTIYRWAGILECVVTDKVRCWKFQGRGYNEKAALETLNVWAEEDNV